MGMKDRLIRFRSFWIFPLLSAGLLYATSRPNPSRVPASLWLVPIGIFIWTLLEYTLHRFAFHMRFHNHVLRSLLSASHTRHHAAPRNRDQILVQTRFALAVSAAIYGAFYFAMGAFDSAAVLTGIWLGFLYYEAVHYRAHISLADSPLLRRQRRAHFYHHFSNSAACFGVTSPLWDYVFGTFRRA
jgi:sterol desaturase/sphingolipid hydroxylase (fatty acid hydroxylase superfamily)